MRERFCFLDLRFRFHACPTAAFKYRTLTDVIYPDDGLERRIHRTSYLDGLRGIASLIVFVCHYTEEKHKYLLSSSGLNHDGMPCSWIQLPLLRIIYSGWPMVHVLFVISGASASPYVSSTSRFSLSCRILSLAMPRHRSKGGRIYPISIRNHRLRHQRAHQHADSDPADNVLVSWSARHRAYHCLGDRPIPGPLTSQRCTLPDGSRHSAWMPPTERRRGSQASGYSRPDDCPATFARSLFAKRPRRSHAL